MDTSQYKDEFISEARDYFDVLNEGLLVLEKDQSDMDNINKIFRAFHTLKGNAATMGFMKFSELAHALEDVLSKVRDKQLKVTPDVIDIIFEGCDILEAGLDEISKDNPDNIDVEGLMEELKGIIGAKEDIAKVDDIGEKAKLTEKENKAVDKWKKKNMNVLRVIIVFDKGNILKTAKALLTLRNISKVSELIKTVPVSDEIKLGKFNTEIELIIVTKKKQGEIEKIINSISGLKHVFVLGLDETYERSKETVHEEKELAKAAIANKHKVDVVKQIQSVKVTMKKLDKLMNLVGELLISNIRLQDISKRKDFDSLKTVIPGIDRLTLDLQDEVMQIRMVPIGNIFNRFPRMVRDLSGKEGKKINLVIEGQDIEFDRTVLDEIGEPLVHLLRNCVDHGIEKPEERLNAGKPEEGTVKLIARREKNNAVIEVMDDGKGIDPKKVKESCIRKKIITEEEAAKMSDNELQMLVFGAGVSTNKVVTAVSGRGVGLDVVLSKMNELGGNVKLNSVVGKGTSVIMELPLTVAIVTSLLVKINKAVYAIPLTSVDQTVDVEASQLKTIQENAVFVLRGKQIPLLWLEELLGLNDFEKKNKFTVVIVNKGNSQIGLVVDSIISQQQVLIKGLQDIVKGTKGVAGATIMGDGSVALILDIGTLI